MHSQDSALRIRGVEVSSDYTCGFHHPTSVHRDRQSQFTLVWRRYAHSSGGSDSKDIFNSKL